MHSATHRDIVGHLMSAPVNAIRVSRVAQCSEVLVKRYTFDDGVIINDGFSFLVADSLIQDAADNAEMVKRECGVSEPTYAVYTEGTLKTVGADRPVTLFSFPEVGS